MTAVIKHDELRIGNSFIKPICVSDGNQAVLLAPDVGSAGILPATKRESAKKFQVEINLERT